MHRRRRSQQTPWAPAPSHWSIAHLFYMALSPTPKVGPARRGGEVTALRADGLYCPREHMTDAGRIDCRNCLSCVLCELHAKAAAITDNRESSDVFGSECVTRESVRRQPAQLPAVG